MSIVFSGNRAFFSSPACRKTYSLCTHGRASRKGMAAAAHCIGATSGGARMNFLTMHCGFEDVVANLLGGGDRFKPFSLRSNGTQFSANFVSLFLSFHSLSVKEKVFTGKDSSNSRFVASEARSSLG